MGQEFSKEYNAEQAKIDEREAKLVMRTMIISQIQEYGFSFLDMFKFILKVDLQLVNTHNQYKLRGKYYYGNKKITIDTSLKLVRNKFNLDVYVCDDWMKVTYYKLQEDDEEIRIKTEYYNFQEIGGQYSNMFVLFNDNKITGYFSKSYDQIYQSPNVSLFNKFINNIEKEILWFTCQTEKLDEYINVESETVLPILTQSLISSTIPYEALPVPVSIKSKAAEQAQMMQQYNFNVLNTAANFLEDKLNEIIAGIPQTPQQADMMEDVVTEAKEAKETKEPINEAIIDENKQAEEQGIKDEMSETKSNESDEFMIVN